MNGCAIARCPAAASYPYRSIGTSGNLWAGFEMPSSDTPSEIAAPDPPHLIHPSGAMAFTFIDFRASPTGVAVTSRCSELPCGSSGSIDLRPKLEISGTPRFDVIFAITQGDAKFCRHGSATIVKEDVEASSLPEPVRFCRGSGLSHGYDSITVRATVTERGGLSHSRETVITVRPLDLGQLDAQPAAIGRTDLEALDVALELPTARRAVPAVVNLSVAQRSDVWFDDGGRRTKILRMPVLLGPARQRLDERVHVLREEGADPTEDVLITASVHADGGGFLGQRRVWARLIPPSGK